MKLTNNRISKDNLVTFFQRADEEMFYSEILTCASEEINHFIFVRIR